ncbi:hypothetical protein Sjap_026039 [Stephania japonica]|uniref:Uncharacterized protein n=1 Tax=Stephania japonica TaxID=461633 RepID=A0AAP0EAM6_9MAGN
MMSPSRMSPNTSSSSRGTSFPLPSVGQSSEPSNADVEIQDQAPMEDRDEPPNVRIPIKLSKKKKNPMLIPSEMLLSWDSCINAQIWVVYDRKVNIRFIALLNTMLKKGVCPGFCSKEVWDAYQAYWETDVFKNRLEKAGTNRMSEKEGLGPVCQHTVVDRYL